VPTRKSTFDIKSTTIKIAFPPVGVLMSAQGTYEQAEDSGFVGSCNDKNEETQDLEVAGLAQREWG